MNTYQYKGVNSAGDKVEGVVEALSRTDAAAKARENCCTLSSIEETGSGKLFRILSGDVSDLLPARKIGAKKLAVLCSQLAIELKAGLPLVSSLKLISENEKDKKMKKMIDNVASDVQAGSTLADGFENYGNGLPVSFIESVRSGEESGRMDTCFERLQKYYEDEAATASKVANVMIYPVMLILTAIAVITIIMVVAVPQFEKSFSSIGRELPGVTRALISISHFVKDDFLILLAAIAVIAGGLILFGRTRTGQKVFSKIQLMIPVTGNVAKMKASNQLASALSTMLASGLPMVHAVQIAANTLSNRLIAEEAIRAANGVLEGNRLGDGLRKSKWLPNLLLEMISVGEETGNLEQTLDVAREYYAKEVDCAVHRALEILNPVITVILAGIVVFILLSVYMPMMTMYGSI